jgi:hypothetical protein
MDQSTSMLNELLPLLASFQNEVLVNVDVLEVSDVAQLVELAANPKIRRHLLARLSEGAVAPICGIMRPFPALAVLRVCLTSGQGNVWLANLCTTADSHTPLKSTTRIVTTTWPPGTSQFIPDCFRRSVNTLLQAASVTPLPIGKPTPC